MKYITTERIIIAGLLIVLIWLVQCNGKKKVLPPPPVNDIPQQIIQVRADSIMSQKQKDSIIRIIQKTEGSANYWKNAFNVAAQEAKSLEQGMNDLLTQEVPDTCKAIQAQLRGEFSRLSVAQREKDTAHRRIIAAKDSIIDQKDALVANGKEDYRKLKQNFDYGIRKQDSLFKYISKISPRREVYLGATGTTQQLQNYGYGLNLGYRDRKGNQYEAGVLQIGRTTNFTVAYKKTLFKF